jgi:hypothetical protein
LIVILNLPAGAHVYTGAIIYPATLPIMHTTQMKVKILLWIICCITFSSCNYQNKQDYIFFLHNRFLEEHSLTEAHPEHGRAEYHEIIKAFEKEGIKVISEKRPGNVNARDYALKVKTQIDSLLSAGVEPNSITVIGTSKGGYIAQYVSTLANNPNLNFVFVASYRDSDIERIPEINFCGNILTIYEKTDDYGVSALRRKETSTLQVNHFKEVELNTGLRHGFLFKPLQEWIEPSVQWAKQNYELN